MHQGFLGFESPVRVCVAYNFHCVPLHLRFKQHFLFSFYKIRSCLHNVILYRAELRLLRERPLVRAEVMKHILTDDYNSNVSFKDVYELIWWVCSEMLFSLVGIVICLAWSLLLL